MTSKAMSRMSKSWLAPGDESAVGAAYNTLVDSATLAKNVSFGLYIFPIFLSLGRTRLLCIPCIPQYGLLAKATDAGGGGSEGGGDTPGYVYKELTELTFEGGPRVGAALAQTLTKSLLHWCRPSKKVSF